MTDHSDCNLDREQGLAEPGARQAAANGTRRRLERGENSLAGGGDGG